MKIHNLKSVKETYCNAKTLARIRNQYRKDIVYNSLKSYFYFLKNNKIIKILFFNLSCPLFLVFSFYYLRNNNVRDLLEIDVK